MQKLPQHLTKDDRKVVRRWAVAAAAAYSALALLLLGAAHFLPGAQAENSVESQGSKRIGAAVLSSVGRRIADSQR